MPPMEECNDILIFSAAMKDMMPMFLTNLAKQLSAFKSSNTAVLPPSNLP